MKGAALRGVRALRRESLWPTGDVIEIVPREGATIGASDLGDALCAIRGGGAGLHKNRTIVRFLATYSADPACQGRRMT